MLKGNDNSLPNTDHHPQNESTKLLIATAACIHPPSKQRCVAAIAADQDESGHLELARHIPSCQDRVAERKQEAYCEANGPSAAKLVRSEASTNHEDEVDRANRCWDIIDFGHGVCAERFQPDAEVLDDVRSACECPK